MNSIMILQTPEKNWAHQDFQFFLKQVENFKHRKNKAYSMFWNDKIRMEFYHESNSLWWTNLEWENQEIHQIQSIPSDNECISVSNDFLKSHQLDNEFMKLRDVDYDTATSFDKITGKTKHFVTAINVSYEYQIDGLPVFGSGAKAKIVLNENKEVVEWYRFWREIKPFEKRKTITPELAMKLFQQSPTFKRIQSRKLKTEFLKPRLGYYAFPPRIKQETLWPVYKIQGHCNSKENPIIHEYVPALSLSLDSVKKMKMYNGNEFCQDITHYLRRENSPP